MDQPVRTALDVPAWAAALRIAELAASAGPMRATASAALEVLSAQLDGAATALSMADPVSGEEHTIAMHGRVSGGTAIELRTLDGRVTGHLRLEPGAADHPRWSHPALERVPTLLAGLVDWMRGPVFMTSIVPPDVSVAIATDAGEIIAIPGRDPGAHLTTGSALARIIAAEHPSRERVNRFWWRDPTGSWHRVRTFAGPAGTLVVESEQRLPEGLRPRELDTITLIAQGLTNAQIATRLGVSESTVAKHVESALRTTGAASRAELAARSHWEGLAVRPLPGTGPDTMDRVAESPTID